MSPDALLLIVAVAVVGVLHTVVPDHWVPIVLLARQQGWTKTETARASLQAGVGHVLTTLVIGLAVWVAGVAFATRFGQIVDLVTSLALIGFGAWIGIGSWLELRPGSGGHHHHHHGSPAHATDHGHEHGPEHSHEHEVAGSSQLPTPKTKASTRMALLVILGSSPMVEGIPAFFAASKFGPTVILVMAVVFALSTIVTYVGLCVYSAVGLQRLQLGRWERYGEVISGAFIALVGLVFLIWPVV